MVWPPCLSQQGGRDRSLFTAAACRSGCRRSAGLHTFTLRSCELQPVGPWAAPSRPPGSFPQKTFLFFPRLSARSHQSHVFFLVIQRLPLSLRVKQPRHTIHYSRLRQVFKVFLSEDWSSSSSVFKNHYKLSRSFLTSKLNRMDTCNKIFIGNEKPHTQDLQWIYERVYAPWRRREWYPWFPLSLNEPQPPGWNLRQG